MPGAPCPIGLHSRTSAPSYAAILPEDTDPWPSEPCAKRPRFTLSGSTGWGLFPEFAGQPWLGRSSVCEDLNGFARESLELKRGAAPMEDLQAKRPRMSPILLSQELDSKPSKTSFESVISARALADILSTNTEVVFHHSATIWKRIRDAFSSELCRSLPLRFSSGSSFVNEFSTKDVRRVLALLDSTKPSESQKSSGQLLVFRKGSLSVENLETERDAEEDEEVPLPGLVIYAQGRRYADLEERNLSVLSFPQDTLDAVDAVPMEL